MIDKEKRGVSLVTFNTRMTRDWVNRVKIMAKARRTTMTGIVFAAVEKEWLLFKGEKESK